MGTMRAECGGSAGQNSGGRVSKNQGLEGHVQGPACRPSVCRQARRSQDDRGWRRICRGVGCTHPHSAQAGREGARAVPTPRGAQCGWGSQSGVSGRPTSLCGAHLSHHSPTVQGARQPRFQPGSPHFPLRDQLQNSLHHNYRR